MRSAKARRLLVLGLPLLAIAGLILLPLLLTLAVSVFEKRGFWISPAFTLDAYRLPTIADVPEIVCELVDEPDTQLTNLGAKGIGEPPIIPVAAAIANAIRDATGADVRSLPITREEMLAALSDVRRKGRLEEREPVTR